ncbi:MAG: hypothetical protein HOD92_22810 [Deltaproteobacteria bacterium]|jgi:hypothetical protein|nr:hypothetical protein [Deltaproteobacteria bacterium]
MDSSMSAEDNEKLDKWIGLEEPIDRGNATKALKEVKHILDGFGVKIFLRQGTCLGAIRNNDFLPWDDDVDIGSVIGFHGVTEKSLDQIVNTFRNNGFLARIDSMGVSPYIPLVKYSTRIDWQCYKAVDDYIVHFPFLKIPLDLLKSLKEISFLGETFLVPNPPEKYLRLKYGEDWKTPKKPGNYEEDVLKQVAEMPAPNNVGKFRQWIAKYFPSRRLSMIKALDQRGNPICGCEVDLVGLGCFKTSKQGYVRFYVPRVDYHPLTIRYEDNKETNYVQKIKPATTYIFQPKKARLTAGNPVQDSGNILVEQSRI